MAQRIADEVSENAFKCSGIAQHVARGRCRLQGLARQASLNPDDGIDL